MVSTSEIKNIWYWNHYDMFPYFIYTGKFAEDKLPDIQSALIWKTKQVFVLMGHMYSWCCDLMALLVQ